MWNRILPLLFLAMSMSAHAEQDWHPETVSYQVKEKTRFYQWSNFDKERYQQIYSSFVIPRGLVVNGCGSVREGFLEGKDCAQADDLTIEGVLEKAGKKRKIEIELYASWYKPDSLKNSTQEERLNAMKSATKPAYGNDVTIGSGNFYVSKEEGFFVIKKRPYEKNNDEYYKFLMRTNLPCGFRAFYREMEPGTGGRKYFASKDWLFEGVFDEIVRSMRCEEVPWDYVEKQNSLQEEKSKKSLSKKK